MKLRYAFLLFMGCLASGCERDVALQNPQTGATETCRTSMAGMNPWSQTSACVANHIAQGWTISGRD